MNTVEVPSQVSGDFRRLARATGLLVAGAAVHLWLFPFPTAQRTSGLLDRMAAGIGTVVHESAVGTTGAAPGVATSALGTVAPPAQGDRASVSSSSTRVKVLVQTVHPTVATPSNAVRPLPLQNAVFKTVLPPEPPAYAPLDEVAPPAPDWYLELPAVSDAPAPHELDTRVREAKPSVSAETPAPGAADRLLPAVDRDFARRAERPSEERLVSYVLQQYRAAYESLDVGAAQTIWPTVDARALGAAFRQLAGQRVTFDSCGVSVSGSGSQATARCKGQAEYVPKVGGRRTYTASGEWVFDLQKENAAWRIINANASIK